MMMLGTHRRTAVVAALSLVPLAVASAGAFAADSSVGDITPPNGSICGGPYTELQAASAQPSYVVPSDGVITSVRIVGDATSASTRAFKLGRATGTAYAIVGSTTPTQIGAGATVTQSVRIPTKAGDVIGISYLDGTTHCVNRNGTAQDAIVQTSGDVGVGGTVSLTQSANLRIPVSATVEPDADHDGYGDTTQDACPAQANNAAGLCDFTVGHVGAPSGRAKAGKRLSAPAITLPGGSTETFQWFRITKRKGHHAVTRAIRGATGARYAVRRGDRGKKLFVQITLSHSGYSGSAVRSLARRIG